MNSNEPNPANPDSECWAFCNDKNEAARFLLDAGEQSILENCYKATRAYRFATLFSGYTLTNLQGYGANVGGNGWAETYPGIDFPIIKNRCRTLAKTFIAKSFANDCPEPAYTTKGGDFDQVLKADDINDLMVADFAEPHGAYGNIHQMHCMGGLIATTATGRYFIFCIDYDSSTYPECELDDSLTIGIWRAQQHGAIRMLTRTVWMNPEECIRRMGKKHRDAIYANTEERKSLFEAGRGLQDTGPAKHIGLTRRVVKVTMGWQVQVGDTAGREMFILKDKHILRDRVYTRRRPPCTYWDFETSLDGEDPIPLTQSVYRLEMYQNRIMNDVDTTERTTPQLVLVMQAGGGGTNGGSSGGKKATSKSVLQSKAVQVIQSEGPIDQSMKTFEMPKYSKDSLGLEKLYDDAIFEEAQIGRSHATGVKPEGTTSGIQESLAASYYTETFAEAERRSITCRAIETPGIMLPVYQKLVKRPKGFTKWVGSGKFMRQLQHTDLDLDDDKYVVAVKAMGEGKDSPKTRMEKAMQLLKDPTVQFTGADLVSVWKTYDVDRLADRIFAIEEWVEDQTKRYMKSSRADMDDINFYEPPEIWMQLAGLRTSLAIMAKAYLDARSMRIPPERQKWFERFCNDCVALIQSEEKRVAINNAGKVGGMPGAPPPIPSPGLAQDSSATNTPPAPQGQ